MKKDKESIWGRGTRVGRDLEIKRRNSTPSGIFKKAAGLGLNPVDGENKDIYLLIHFQVTNYMSK